MKRSPKEKRAVQLVGKIGEDDLQVVIRKTVFDALERYAAADVTRERGMILIGNEATLHGKPATVITACIEARYCKATASTLTFTHDTWRYINDVRETLYSQSRVVGWQHTHPGYGIFLSNYDLFIHENFFDLPFQVAYVIDPVQHLRGFFQWKNGKIEKLHGFFVEEACDTK